MTRTRALPMAAMLTLAGLAAPGAGEAQPLCVGSPRSLPMCNQIGSCTRFDGAPTWVPQADKSQYDPDGDDQSSSQVNDARWAGTARRPYQGYVLANKPEDVYYMSGDTTFRIAYHESNGKNYLLVNFETRNAKDEPDTRIDAVYFGFMQPGSTARALEIKVPRNDFVDAAADSPQLLEPTQDSVFRLATKGPADASWTVPAFSTSAKPRWLVAPAVWAKQTAVQHQIDDTQVREPDNSWGISFKINLDDAELSDLTTGTYRVFAGTTVAHAWTTSASYYRSPNLGPYLERECPIPGDPSSCTDLPEAQRQRKVFDEVDGAGMVPRNTDVWHETTGIGVGDGCEGFDLKRSLIGVLVDDGNPDTDDYLTPGRTFVVDENAPPHTVIATPVVPEGYDNADGVLQASFRVANWGAQPNYNTAWSDRLENATDTQRFVQSVDGHFDLTCKPSTADTTCGLPTGGFANNREDPNESHQCMLVEIQPVSDPNVPIKRPSEFQNMIFARASTVERTATLDVRGLEAITGVAQDRDVYLYVTRRNMPDPSSEEKFLDRNAMALAAYSSIGQVGCTAEEACIETNYQPPVCATQCDPFYYSCPPNTHMVDTGGCWCQPNTNARACFPDQMEGQPDLDPDAQIARAWPYIQVQPYYATGYTRDVEGEQVPIVEPMFPFSMAVTHIGGHYGFLSSLRSLDVQMEEIAEDVYKLTVPNETSVRLEVSVTAIDHEEEVPLTDIYGAATSWGVFGAATIVGVSSTDRPVDLSTATVQLTEMLSEDGNELVTNLGAPVTLEPAFGAHPDAAVFHSTQGAPITLSVVELPLLGRVSTLTAANVNIQKPDACGWFGTATLSTSFTIADASNPPVLISGEDDWSCLPYKLVN